MEEARQMDENHGPAGSISVAVSRQTKSSIGSSTCIRPRASSERLKVKLDKVALMVQAAAQMEEQALEEHLHMDQKCSAFSLHLF